MKKESFGISWGTLLLESFKKLSPSVLIRNPVMASVFLGFLVTLFYAWQKPTFFYISLVFWFGITVLFANFAEAMAESRGKRQAEALRRTREKLSARRMNNGLITTVAAHELKVGDRIVCEAGETIAADGEVVEGVASVDESAMTGESAPVIRESGGDRSAVTGGTRVLSDRIVVKVTAEQGSSFLDRMITLIESAKRQRTPNEIALNIVLFALTVLFVGVVATLPFLSQFGIAIGGGKVFLDIPVLIALYICLIPTTIAGLLSAIGIGGIDRLLRRNVLATSGKSVEAAGDIDVLLLDKTGTITLGNRVAIRFIPAPGVSEIQVAEAGYYASLSDETPEGRSIVELAKNNHGLRPNAQFLLNSKLVPFRAETRMSGIDFLDEKGALARRLRKGAADSIKKDAEQNGGQFPQPLSSSIEEIARSGGTPLVVSEGNRILGVVHLKDMVKGGIRDRFAELRKMGVRTVMITGDNPLTAAAIAAEAGVDDFVAEAKPEHKLAKIREEQAKGHLVAMIGDGTNDAPALAQADVGVAMQTGTQAAREAGNMIDLDSNPTKLLEIVSTGKQILITRGALTTFSFANDVAKYFAILPAMFAGLYAAVDGPKWLAKLDLMKLHSGESAILSAVIYNAVIIPILIPLAIRGVSYRATHAAALFRRNLLIYGVGGILAPFLGIKLIDLVVALFVK
ncbi:MAG: potassium-transporting ATPase subunit KdpB [Spirochaetia bacterium]|nr:potassium-transporting ATPase subunit KdpB [Spirochaetia bacterium]